MLNVTKGSEYLILLIISHVFSNCFVLSTSNKRYFTVVLLGKKKELIVLLVIDINLVE